MAITLAKLCVNAEATYGMKLLAGSDGLENFVRWVHIIEDSEFTHFLHNNELAFTTGIAQTNKKDWLLEFVSSIHKKNASGLVINIGPYVEAVPKQVIDFCNQHNLPLFTLPWKARLIDITYDFCHRIVASEEIEVGLATAFRNLIFMPQEDATYRPTLERQCFYPDASYCVIAFGLAVQSSHTLSDNALRNIKLQIQKLLNKSNKLFSLFFHDKNLIIILHNFTDQQIDELIKMAQDICEMHTTQLKLTAGVSPIGKGYSFVSEAYTKAIMALRVAKLNNKRSIHYQNMGIYKLLVSVDDKYILYEIYNENLGALEAFDQKNKTDYMETLRCYLEHDSSVQTVAQKTFVHRNTVNYKIKRIRQILHCDFSYENKLKLMLSFLIRDLL